MRRDFRQKKIKCSRALAVGAGEPPAFAVAGGDLPLRKPSKGRDLGLESALNLANVGSHSRHSDRGWSGAGLIDRRSGLSRLIPIILGEVHVFAGDLRAIFAV